MFLNFAAILDNFRSKEIYFVKVDAISIIRKFWKGHLGKLDDIKFCGVFCVKCYFFFVDLCFLYFLKLVMSNIHR